MKDTLLRSICVLFVLAVYGQHDRQAVDQMISESTATLKEKGIHSWVVNWRYCEGRVEMIKMPDGSMCISQGTYYEAYLVWSQDDRSWVAKFDNCSSYKPVELEGAGIPEFIDQNMNDFFVEEVRLYESANYTGDPELRKKPEPCFSSFEFKDGERSREVSFNLYQMTTSEEEPNTNYEHNKSLAIYGLDRMFAEWAKANRTRFRRKK